MSTLLLYDFWGGIVCFALSLAFYAAIVHFMKQNVDFTLNSESSDQVPLSTPHTKTSNSTFGHGSVRST